MSVSEQGSIEDEELDSGWYPSTGRSRRRTIVKPPVFVLDGKETLAAYLQVYEEYFRWQFDGNDNEMTQELANFIDGKLLEVYNIKSGQKLKYSQMKEELLNWYKKQRIGGKGYWRKEFEMATPGREESYDMYGLRLIELAKLAFPDSKSERARQLRHQFLTSVEGEIAQRIADAELSYKVNPSCTMKHMPFNSIVEIAHELKKQSASSRKPAVMWSTSISSQPSVSENQPHHSRSFSHGRSNTRSLTPKRVVCHYCKRGGHIAAECWRAAKACLICGGRHHIEGCPRYDPSRQKATKKTESSQKRTSIVTAPLNATTSGQ